MQESHDDIQSGQIRSLQIHLVISISRFNEHESRSIRGSLPDLNWEMSVKRWIVIRL